MMPSSGVNGEATHMEHIHQDNLQELTDGITSMDTSYEHAFVELHFRDEIVAYDPSALGPVDAFVVRAKELLPGHTLCHRDSIYLMSLSRSLQATSRKSVATNP
ncbi:hypothetical protein CRYUN_Cryun12cG0130500 [Craigia yunnanensis]